MSFGAGSVLATGDDHGGVCIWRLDRSEPSCEMLAGSSDEASLVERIGRDVFVVLGSERNLKITTADDLRLAEMFAGSDDASATNGS